MKNIYLACLLACTFLAQSSLAQKGYGDTAILFKDPGCRLTVRLFADHDHDGSQNNAVLTYSKSGRIVFADSVHSHNGNISFRDFNNDGTEDVLIANTTSARSNETFYLFLKNDKAKTLRRVKGFEKIVNPSLDKKYNIITEMRLYGKISHAFFRINKSGELLNLGHEIETEINDLGNKYEKAIRAIVANDPVITVDLNKETGDMTPIWAWFGYDEPNYTYMKDGKKLLSELAELSPVPVFVRTHNLLTTGDGTPALKWGSTNAYTEDANGRPIYNWTIVDSIFDTYVQRGMKPLVQIGFMPEALSSKPQPYKHNWRPGAPYREVFTGWAYPPNDYNKWRELVYQWAKHCLDRYGRKEVESWYWEVWNEPNIPYWQGTMQEFFKTYDYAADGLLKALPFAKIGGCNITGGGSKFLEAFIRHCLDSTNYATGKLGSPLDLVLFHAKGQPRVVNGSVVMNVGTQMRNIRDAMKTVNLFPRLKNIPLVIGESDPEGCAACGMSTNPENAYRNGTMYSSYTAASFARKYLLADELKTNLMGAVSWSFEFEDQPWFAGFRDLATNGVDKPVLNVFRMFGMMKGRRVETQGNRMYPLQTFIDSSVRGSTDIGAIASKDKKIATIMLWNYHDEDKPGTAESVNVTIKNLSANAVTITEYRVDSEHSNSYEVWKKMGSPQNPTPEQISTLEKAGKLSMAGKPAKIKTKNREAALALDLPRQAVVLLKVEW